MRRRDTDILFARLETQSKENVAVEQRPRWSGWKRRKSPDSPRTTRFQSVFRVQLMTRRVDGETHGIQTTDGFKPQLEGESENSENVK